MNWLKRTEKDMNNEEKCQALLSKIPSTTADNENSSSFTDDNSMPQSNTSTKKNGVSVEEID